MSSEQCVNIWYKPYASSFTTCCSYVVLGAANESYLQDFLNTQTSYYDVKFIVAQSFRAWSNMDEWICLVLKDVPLN